MRECSGIKHEEWPMLMLLNKFQRLFMDKIAGVNSFVLKVVSLERDLLVVMPQVLWIISMGFALAVVAIKFIEALMIRISFGSYKSQPPLSKSACSIACFT